MSRLAQYCAKPTKGGVKALNRVLGYLSTSRDRKLWVPRVKGNQWVQRLYSDSDHIGDVAAGTTKSHTGIVMLVNGMPIYWKSKKQSKISLSSAATKIYAMAQAVKGGSLRMWVAGGLHRK